MHGTPHQRVALPSATGLIAVCGLALAACLSQPEPTPNVIYITATPAMTPSPTLPEAAALDAGRSPCEHLLWPLRDGASWAYEMVAPQGITELTLTSSVGEVGATLAIDGQERSLICGEDLLAGLPPLPVGHPGLGREIVGQNPVGSYLPAPALLLPLGQPATWDQESDAAGTISLPFPGGENAPIVGGKIVLIQQAEELATVNVPAGEFLSLPIRQDVLFDLQVQLPGGTAESVLISAAARHYYAEGVGLVRANYDGGTVSTQGGAWPLEAGLELRLVRADIP